MLLAVQSVLMLFAGALLLLTLSLSLELLLLSVAAALPGRAPRRAATFPPVARLVVIVPGHDEEGCIRTCVESIVQSLAPYNARSEAGPDRVLVVAHNCTDRTAEFAAEAGADIAVLNDPDLRGKGNALAHGFHLAFGQYGADAVLIVDADSIVSPNLVACVRAALSQHMVVQTRYESRPAISSARGRLQGLSFFAKNVVRAAGRQRLGLSCGIFGNGFAFRREVLDRVPYAAHSIVEDLEFHLSLIASGISTGFVPAATVLAEVPASAVGQRTQTARWEGGRIQMVRAQAPRLVSQVIRGRIALAEPLLDLLGLPIAIQVILLTVLLLLPLPFFRLYAIAGFLALAFHLLVAVGMSPDPRGTAHALLQAPWYVLKKASMTPAIVLMSGKRASWVKTSRVRAEK